MISPNTLVSPKWFFQLLDASGVLLAYGATWLTLPEWGVWLNPDFREIENSSAGLLVLTLPLWLLLLDWGGMYGDPVHLSYAHIVGGMGRVLVVSLSLVTLVVFGIKEQGVSRLFVFSFGAMTFAILTALRFTEKAYYDTRHRAGYYARRPLVIGSPQSIQLLRRVIEASDSGATFRVTDLPVDKADVESRERVQVFSDRLRERLARQAIGEVVLVLNDETLVLRQAVRSVCAELGQPVWMISEPILELRAASAGFPAAGESFFMGMPALLLLRGERKPGYEFAKRLLDLVFSAVLLVLLSPVLVVIALAVKLSSPGPLFYRWRVLGQNNREFTGYKFRTMVHNADQLKPALLRYNEMSGPVFKMKRDPRVTPIGRFLRRYSLDELPQLFSVLKGDMSLVGPRPPLKSEFERFEFWHTRKLSVKPGITCLWQAGGRNEIKDFDEWVRLDLEYIDRRSLAMDFQIMARTALAVLKGTGR